MWRHLARGLQQRFRKSHCFEKPENCVKTEGENTPRCQSNKCKVIQSFIPTTYQNLNCLIFKHTQNKRNKEDYHENPSRNIGQHTFLEAFGWSGALVFGWAVSNHLWLTKKWTCDDESKKFINDQSFIQLLAQIVKTQPPVTYVLPKLQPSSIGSKFESKILNSDEFSKLNEEFDKAAQELMVAHERAIGEALNRKGIACLSKSTGSEAIKYFLRAADFKYAPASFNMGQCYELGIGTKQDFKQAAEWYKVASEQGHATAMYNLGVFYAHGWGGLLADINCARRFFAKAAKLGQPDAIAALDKESLKHKAKVEHQSHSSGCETDSLNIAKNYCTITADNTSTKNFVNSNKKGFSDDLNIFQKEFASDYNWNTSFNSAIAF